MKKFTFAAAAAALALGANAQNMASTPYANASVKEGVTATFDIISAADEVLTGLQGAGQTVNDWRVNEENRFLYVWDNTLVGGDASYPGVGYSDMQFDGYVCFEVGSIGWSGAGFNLQAPANCSTMHWNDNTRYHLAYRSGGTAPASIGLIINDQDGVNTPAKVSLGEAFNDNGVIFPAVGEKANDEWQALDISFADLKKTFPAFGYSKTAAWAGNIMSFLAGGIPGQTFSFDCIYFYTPSAGAGIADVADDSNLILGNETINANGAIEVYDLQGRLVRSGNGVVGLDGLDGVYVARSGKSVVKVIR